MKELLLANVSHVKRKIENHASPPLNGFYSAEWENNYWPILLHSFLSLFATQRRIDIIFISASCSYSNSRIHKRKIQPYKNNTTIIISFILFFSKKSYYTNFVHVSSHFVAIKVNTICLHWCLQDVLSCFQRILSRNIATVWKLSFWRTFLRN